MLVTGASGFIGRHCVERLRCTGARICAVSQSTVPPQIDGVEWHLQDLRAPDAAEKLIAAVRPTHLLHGAWVASPRSYRESPENTDWLRASITLVRAFAEAGGRRFVGVGSSAEYDKDGGVCAEDTTPIRPATLYGKCKAEFWQAAVGLAERHGMSAAWGRLFLPYGPGDHEDRLIPTLLAAFVAGQSVATTDGLQKRDFVYAPDVADCLGRLLAMPAACGAFNVGTGRAIAVRYVIERIAEHFGAHHLLHIGARYHRLDEPKLLIADTTKLEKILRWRAPTQFEVGLTSVLAVSAGRRHN